jgi:hypothetical protein
LIYIISTEAEGTTSLILHGKPHPTWLTHQVSIKGAVLDFHRSSIANKKRGTKGEAFPFSVSNEKLSNSWRFLYVVHGARGILKS